ncbi:MAG: FtsH protease activity modulator HflK [Holosporales bacterium]|jgi:membrane protease subunit HflK
MPWQSNGGDNNPWGKKPEGKGQETGSDKPQRPRQPIDPDIIQINDFFKKSQQQFRGMFPGKGKGGGNPFAVFAGIGAIVIVLWLVTGFYRVRPSEVGIETTFGVWTNKAATLSDGLHFHWPSPIGESKIVNVTGERRVSIGYKDSPRDPNLRQDVPGESLMLTGDENIVDVDFRITWDIKNAGDFLFNIDDPLSAVKRAGESAMREIIGQKPFTFVLSDKRRDIESAVVVRAQELLDDLNSGIRVRAVFLEAVNPPASVVDAFREVQRARTDAETAKNQAESYRNDILPKAEGQAIAVVQEAQGYREKVISQARGDADRFRAVHQAYLSGREVTSTRLYYETVEQVLRGANKIVVDNEKQSVTPYFLPVPGLGGGGAVPPKGQ